MSSEEPGQMCREILKQREKAAIKRQNLPYLMPGMSPRARALEIRRAANRERVRQTILKAWEEEKRQRPEPTDPAEGAAWALLCAMNNGDQQRRGAEEFLKTADLRIKEKMLDLAGVTSEWKQRRSRKPNGF